MREERGRELRARERERGWGRELRERRRERERGRRGEGKGVDGGEEVKSAKRRANKRCVG